MFDLNANSLKQNIIVIKKYNLLSCHLGWMNSRRFCLQKGDSQEHISLITIMFFNEFAFTVQVKHKINRIQILGFILICFILWLVISTHVYFAKNVAYFSFNSWLSFQRLCRLIWGYHFHFVDSIMLQIILWFLSLPGTSRTSATATKTALLTAQLKQKK